MLFQYEGFHFRITDSDAGLVRCVYQDGFHLQTGNGGRGADTRQHDLERGERGAGPSPADFAKQPMLYRIP